MGRFSDFIERLKVKTEDKVVKTYTFENISIRKYADKDALELYIVEIEKISKNKQGWAPVVYQKTEANIKKPDEKSSYFYMASPTGQIYNNTYSNNEIYKEYSVPTVLKQIGETNTHFTEKELIELIEKNKREKENAIFKYIDKVEYGRKYKGQKTLKGKHVARMCKEKRGRAICLEDKNIKIKINDNGTLETRKDGKKEMVATQNYEFVPTDIIEQISLENNEDLGGYTLEGLEKALKERMLEKNK